MPYQLIYFDEVLSDIQHAKVWYKEQNEDLETAFADEIEACIDKILQMPASFAIRYRKIRIAHSGKFPYNIHFFIDEPKKTVVITGIIHNKRDPAVGRRGRK